MRASGSTEMNQKDLSSTPPVANCATKAWHCRMATARSLTGAHGIGADSAANAAKAQRGKVPKILIIGQMAAYDGSL